MVVSLGFDTIHARSLQKAFRKLGEEAKDEIRELMAQIAANETAATIQRMDRKSQTRGDIYDRVADGIDFDIYESSIADGIPSIRFGVSSKYGAGDFAGIRGSRGANIAGILAFGKAQGSPLKKGIMVEKPKGWGLVSGSGPQGFLEAGRGISGGYSGMRMYLAAGWSSRARPADEDLLEKAMENMQLSLERSIPLAIERAYSGKTIFIDGKVGQSQ